MKTIEEAIRYIDNAREILREKARKEDGYYQDKKYVKMAGHTAYSGVLVALDGLVGVKKKGRKSIDWYQAELGKIDKKALNLLNNVYSTLHLALGYDGNTNAAVAQAGFQDAESLIRWAETKLESNPSELQ